MTYRRETGDFAAATTTAMRAGQDWLAEQIGVSPSRLRQCANPTRDDTLPIRLACAADVACAKVGLGTPLFDSYRRQLVAAGALRPEGFERRAGLLQATLRAIAALIQSALVQSGAGDCEPQGVAA